MVGSTYAGAKPVHISVVIPTCNRPADVERCLNSLCLVEYPTWGIVVVDQSDNDCTQKVVASFAGRLVSLRYKHTSEKGLSRARNLGVAITCGDIVAFLDDDCTVNSNWLEQIYRAFIRHPRAALVFGSVCGAAHDPREFFIPAYEVKRERALQGRWALAHTAGMGASMYLRRAACQHIGRFDELLGPGTPYFSGGDDDDYRYRSLMASYSVVKTPSIKVQHYGARSLVSGSAVQLTRGYALSAGALDMKLLRCGEMAAITLLVAHSLYCLSRINVRNLVIHPRSSNVDWIVMYACGLWRSFRLDIDRQECMYKMRANGLRPAEREKAAR